MTDIEILIKAQQILEKNCKDEDDKLLLEWIDNRIKKIIDKEIYAIKKRVQ